MFLGRTHYPPQVVLQALMAVCLPQKRTRPVARYGAARPLAKQGCARFVRMYWSCGSARMRIATDDKAAIKYQTYSSAMPFSANSFFAFSFLAKCIRPMPRRTLGALVN
jgi:hypothetical protein